MTIYKRLIQHKSRLLNNKCENSYMQRSFNKHGINYFYCFVLAYCKHRSILTFLELNYLNSFKKVYNLRQVEDSIIHSRRFVTKETRDKLSKIHKGNKPKNLDKLHKENKRKINYYVDDVLIKTFNSCKEAAKYFNMKTNIFNLYIGTKRKQKSKYFKLNEFVDYARK